MVTLIKKGGQASSTFLPRISRGLEGTKMNKNGSVALSFAAQIPGLLGMAVFALFLAVAIVVFGPGCATTNSAVETGHSAEDKVVEDKVVEDKASDQCIAENQDKRAQCVVYSLLARRGDYLDAAHKASQQGLGGKYVEAALEPLFKKYFEAYDLESAINVANQFGIPGWRAVDRVFWKIVEEKGPKWANRGVSGMPPFDVPERYEQAVEACEVANPGDDKADMCRVFITDFRRGEYFDAAKVATMDSHANVLLLGGPWLGKLVAAEYLALDEEGYPKDKERLVKVFNFDQPPKTEVHDIGASAVDR